VGGYRPVFAVAQDQDLWLRLAEVGRCVAMPEVLYEARLSPGSISASRRKEQAKSMKAILDCARLRRSGLSDSGVVEDFTTIRGNEIYAGRILRSRRDARFYYFIGCLLRKRQPEVAIAYFRKSLRAWYLNPKAILRMCLLGRL
jgi:hypothetical protein